jgi:hypothetical protein
LMFSVMAGTSHPLYITDDIIGGDSNPEETVYAGGDFSAGSQSSPYELKWTPGGVSIHPSAMCILAHPVRPVSYALVQCTSPHLHNRKHPCYAGERFRNPIGSA